jgi:hypothetical protein
VTAAPEEAAFALNLICMNADMLPEFADEAGERFFAGRYSIGMWFWEVSRFPDRWRDSFALLEELWAPSAHVAAALEPLATVPVVTMRVPVAPARLEPRARAELGIAEDGFVFLFSFDYLSVFKRKNPLAVVDAFTRAFAPGEGARLVVKCINPARDPSAHGELMAAAAARPDIELVDRYLSPSENLSLTAVSDCYVSLHRAEGLGLVMAEAMWLGKPVIATAYSGNLDFMTTENSLLVDHELVPIGPGADPYPPDAQWAEPDVAQAASHMRKVFDDPTFSRALGAKAAEDIRRTHSPEAVGRMMSRRLESIRGTGVVRRRASLGRHSRGPAASSLAARMNRGPMPSAQLARPSAMSRIRGAVRRTTLRLMRPFTVYQQAINQDVLIALDELASRMEESERTTARERARIQQELRRVEQPERADAAHEPSERP